jgi:acetyl esterase/lipase
MTLITPRFDPELAAIVPHFAGGEVTDPSTEDLERFRRLSAPTRDEVIAAAAVTCTDYEVPGFGGEPILVSVIAAQDRKGNCAGVYHVHGGGMIMGNRFAGAETLVEWVLKHGLVCVTVEYRLAPAYPAPTLVEDCYAGLRWMADNAEMLGLDPTRIVVFGGSAGGGLAAGTALLARDRGGPRLLGQLLQCPMLDDRDLTESSRQCEGHGVWDRQQNLAAWNAVLGDRRGTEDVDPYSAPARMADLGNLPPAFIDVGSAETFRDEAVDYAQRILEAGGLCELHIWPGAFHGFYTMAPDAAVSKACIAARDFWLARILAT